MISAIGSSTSQTDLASLLRSSSANTQRTREQGNKPPDPTEMFKSMDTDGNGSVDKNEFTTAMEKMKESQGSQPPPPPPGGGEPPSAEELFAKIDSDSDGQISLAELQTDFESRKPENAPSSGNEPDLSELFDKLDSNSDGQIGESEFKKLLETMEQVRQQQTGPTYGNGTSSSSTSSGTTSLLGYA